MIWWQYLLLVNLYLVLFYGFYALLLRRETFFQLNRLYIVSSGILSFLIPMIQADWVHDLFITRKVKSIIYSSPEVIINFKPIQEQPVTIGQILVFIYIAGAAILTIKFMWQLVLLKRIINEPFTPAAYSFFKKVKLNGALNDRDVIEAHEQVHARQWHSIDILLIELLAVINWFNPVVYLYRKAIKHIHEFIADQQALNNGTNKSDYALLLLSQTFNAPAHHLVNSFFNHSLLKQRIMMLQKSKSNRMMLIKYCLSVPLFILMLIFSSATVNKNVTGTVIIRKAEQVLAQPADAVAITYTARDSAAAGNKKDEMTISLSQSEAVGLRSRQHISDTVKVKKGDEVFNAVEHSPEFPGGINAFLVYLGRAVHYPKVDREHNIQGRVIVTFIVEKDGSLSDVKALRGPDKTLQDEAVRAIKTSPTWIPGVQNGRKVRVQFTVPVNFAIDPHGTIKKDPTMKTGALMPVGKTVDSKISGVVVVDSTRKTGQYYGGITNADGVEPLYIIDGKEVKKQSLTYLSSDKIKSIEVFKDKNATAIYGDKGVNGVIIITTKKAAASN